MSDQQIPAIPEHYRRLYFSFMRLACMMTFLGLLAGILFQESTRKITYTAFGPSIHWEAVYHLALVHGHLFLIGVVIPIVVIVMLHLGLRLNLKSLSPRTLKWGGSLYHTGVGLTALLFFYKGYHYVISIRMGELDFAQIEDQYFAGQHLLRQIVYGVAHSAMGIGLGIFMVELWKTLKEPVGVSEISSEVS